MKLVRLGTQAAPVSRWSLALLVVGAIVAGCSSTSLDGRPAGAPIETRHLGAGAGGADAGADAGAAPTATPQSRVTAVDLNSAAAGTGVGAAGAEGQRVVYFDYDSFAIKSEYQAMLVAHAKALAANRDLHIVVEGHTDERGGSEYNLALGQKRAEAVLRVLVLLGAPVQQLEAVSFGEERPAVEGHDEAAWAKNRRAELKER